MGSFGLGGLVREIRKPASQEQFSLTESIAKFLESGVREDRPGFHISGLYRFCPVRWYFAKTNPKREEISYKTQFRFDIGSSLHSMIQGYLGSMGILKGLWRCENGHTTKVIGVRPKLCEECQSTHLHYREIRVEKTIDDKNFISGRPDGVITVDGEDMGLEIKSVESKVLNMMSEPYDYPVFQLRVYMHLLREMGMFPAIKKGVILYVATSSEETQMLPIKTFMIDHSEDPWKEATTRIAAALDLMKLHESKTITPEKINGQKICTNRTAGKKMYCGYTDECWGIKKSSA
jgi:hypothetical protein